MGNSSSVLKDQNVIRFGILGAARISSKALLQPANKSSKVIVEAVASRSLDKAREYAHKNNIPKFYGSYEELLKDTTIDAVYIPLPNGLHAEWSIKALDAGKHVLCEKPFASNEDEAKAMLEASRRNNKTIVEAVHYRYHPLSARIKEILDSGEIGAIKNVHSDFYVASYLRHVMSEAKEDDIRFNYSLAGGILMDAGSYPINAIRFVTGKEPMEITSAKATLIKPEVDCTMEAGFLFEDGSTGSIYASFRNSGIKPFEASISITGEKGKMHVTNFLLPSTYHTLTIESNGHKRSEKCYGNGGSTYDYQLEAFANEIHGGAHCVTDAADAVKTMKVIDAIYAKAGMKKRGLSE